MSLEDCLALEAEQLVKQNQRFQDHIQATVDDLKQRFQQHDVWFKDIHGHIKAKSPVCSPNGNLIPDHPFSGLEEEDVERSSSRRSRRFKATSVKVELSHFNGNDFHNWIIQAECYFEFYEIDDQEKVQICPLYFTGSALAWYNWLYKNRLVSTWPRLVKAMEDRFGTNYKSLVAMLTHLIQEGNVCDYIERFENLAFMVKAFDEDILVEIFIWGLKDELRRELLITKPSTLSEAIKLALEHEEVEESQSEKLLFELVAVCANGNPKEEAVCPYEKEDVVECDELKDDMFLGEMFLKDTMILEPNGFAAKPDSVVVAEPKSNFSNVDLRSEEKHLNDFQMIQSPIMEQQNILDASKRMTATMIEEVQRIQDAAPTEHDKIQVQLQIFNGDREITMNTATIKLVMELALILEEEYFVWDPGGDFEIVGEEVEPKALSVVYFFTRSAVDAKHLEWHYLF